MNSKRYHVIYDISSVSQNIADKKAISNFLVDLIAKVKMSVLSGPHVVDGIPQNPGITAIVVIDFSHISVHTFTQYNEALVDIFSCKEFDRTIAKKFCQEFFGVDDSSTRQKEVWWG